MSAPVLDAPATAVPELVYRDAASGCRVLVSPPGAAWDRWQEYLAGAWRNYRRHGVESVLDLDDVRDGRSSSLFFTVLDDDGVVVVPRGRARDVLDAALARETREAGIRERYRAGELGLDMNDMRPRLAAKGLTYVEQEPDR